MVVTPRFSFMDKYAALVPGVGAFFGNRSIVIHSANSTRIACANFTMVDMDMDMSKPMPGKPGRGCGKHN